MILKVNSNCCTCNHKYGVRMPKLVNKDITLDKINGNTLWWEAIVQEMTDVRISFTIYEGNVEDLPPGYQGVSFDIIFIFKMGESFRHKYQIVA